MRMTWKTLALAGVCGLAVCGTARADVIYSYDGVISGQFPVGGQTGLTISLRIADAAVQSGSFDLSGVGTSSGAGSLPVTFSGDVPAS